VTSSPDAWTLTRLVTRLRRVLRTAIRTEFPWETLPMAQVEILQSLAAEPGRRISSLAEAHHLAPNTVSNLVQTMVVAGLVSRETDPTDRRAVTLALAPEGEQALGSWLAAHERRVEEALAALDPHDRQVLADALPSLERLVDRLEEGDRPAAGPDDA